MSSNASSYEKQIAETVANLLKVGCLPADQHEPNLQKIAGVVWLGNYETYLKSGEHLHMVIDSPRYHALVGGEIQFISVEHDDSDKVVVIKAAVDVGDEDGFYKIDLLGEFNGASDIAGTENPKDYSRAFHDGAAAAAYVEMLGFLKETKMEAIMGGLKKEAKRRGL